MPLLNFFRSYPFRLSNTISARATLAAASAPRVRVTFPRGSSRSPAACAIAAPAAASPRGPAGSVASSLSSSTRAKGAPAFATRRAAEQPVVALAVGDRVTHDQFGLGTVVGVKGAGSAAEATVDFGGEKPKRLLLRYAPVEKL